MKGSLKKTRLNKAELIGTSILQEMNNAKKIRRNRRIFVVRVRDLGWYRSLQALYQASVC